MQHTTPGDSQYEDYLRHIRSTGVSKSDRTNTGTTSIFGYQMRWDLQRGFPLITTKKVHMRSIIQELLWFLTGSSDNNWLKERNVSIWDEWAKPNGDLGPVYGVQWRKWLGQPFNTYCRTLDDWYAGTDRDATTRKLKVVCTDADGFIWAQEEHDQISDAIHMLKTNPDSRRIIVSAWNVSDLEDMALMPCHAFFQFYVADGRLSCHLYQRSADSFLGVPFNIASYSLLTHMVAQQCNLELGDFIWTGGDCHIYDNHQDQIDLQLHRVPYPFPALNILRKPASIFDYTIDDFEILSYQHHAPIKAPVAV